MFHIAFTQHSGKQTNQQDALWNGTSCIQHRNVPTTVCMNSEMPRLLAVSDGVANSPFPQLASRMLTEILADLATSHELSSRLVRSLHARLCDKYAKGRTFGTSATLVAAQFNNNGAIVVNVGDSRAYHILPSSPATSLDKKAIWHQKSRDHTVLNELIEDGEATPNKGYAQIYQGLMHCLVADDEATDFPVVVEKFIFEAETDILLCSDGLHDVLGDTLLQKLYSPTLSVKEQVDIWRNAVLSRGAPDNFSIILARSV